MPIAAILPIVAAWGTLAQATMTGNPMSLLGLLGPLTAGVMSGVAPAAGAISGMVQPSASAPGAAAQLAGMAPSVTSPSVAGATSALAGGAMPAAIPSTLASQLTAPVASAAVPAANAAAALTNPSNAVVPMRSNLLPPVEQSLKLGQDAPKELLLNSASQPGGDVGDLWNTLGMPEKYPASAPDVESTASKLLAKPTPTAPAPSATDNVLNAGNSSGGGSILAEPSLQQQFLDIMKEGMKKPSWKDYAIQGALTQGIPALVGGIGKALNQPGPAFSPDVAKAWAKMPFHTYPGKVSPSLKNHLQQGLRARQLATAQQQKLRRG